MSRLRPLLALSISLSAAASVHAFGGEDVLGTTINNWHHADISCLGAAGIACPRNRDERTAIIRGSGAGFSPGAAASICWHADYVDSYGYNPLWWASAVKEGGVRYGMHRLKAALSAKHELIKVHFDDLVTMRSITPGRLDGVLSGTATKATLSRLPPGEVIRPERPTKPPIKVIKPPTGTLTPLTPVPITPARPVRTAAELQMRRYLSGTLDGLIYAESIGNVAMAHHIIGVSLHAIEDFYSHSNWIDEPVRRTNTYFDLVTNDWEGMGKLTLFTGTYETPVQTGAAHHGWFGYSCIIMNQPGIKTLLDVGCGGFSPIASDPMCLQFKECQKGTTVKGLVVKGVTIPPNVIYLAPPGINVDSTWMAEIGARERRLVKGESNALPTAFDNARQAHDTAKNLAIKATEQWLRRLGMAMNQLGKGPFWQRVMTENTVGRGLSPTELASNQAGYQKFSKETTDQWEDFGLMGYQFVSAGTYPPKVTDPIEQHFLRLKIKTSTDRFSGTDAEIVAIVDGKEFPLDNMPVKGDGLLKRAIAYNDFEGGDDNVYLVGPLARIPTSVRIENRSKGAVDVVVALGKAFVNAIIAGVKFVYDKIVGFFKTLTGHDPDFVAKETKIWRFEELPQVTGQSRSFIVGLNGGDEGNYEVRGSIRKVGDSVGAFSETASYAVRIDNLKCLKESKWDRLSNSDEPFFATFVNAFDGETPSNRRKLFGPFDDVDAGETRNINYEFPAVTIPKRAGIVSLPILVMESDDESSSERNDILNKFAGDVDKEVKEAGFWDTLGAAIAPDWKVDRIEAWTFSKGDYIRSGRSGTFTNVGWINGNTSRTFTLSTPPALGIRAQDLENMTGVTLSASDTPQRPLVALLALTVGASLIGLGVIRSNRD